MAVITASEKYLELKAEASRLASMANKRLVRLEKNNLTETPAFQHWLDYQGGVKFSVRGKDYNQLQQEMSRLQGFVNAKTSTIRGANQVLKDIAENTGIKYGSVKELQAKSKNFFELVSKVEQYLRQTENSASAIGYQKIWQAVNQYVSNEEVDLSSSDLDMEKAIAKIGEMTSYELIEKGLEGFSIDGKNFEYF